MICSEKELGILGFFFRCGVRGVLVESDNW